MSDIRDQMITEMEHRDAARNTWNAALGDSLPLPAGSTWERKQPARDPRLENVATAAGYSVLSFAVLLFAGAVLAVITRNGDLFRAGVILGVLALVVVWFLLLAGHQRILYVAEKLTGQDLDDDGEIGEPEPRRVTVEIVENNAKTQRIKYLDLPANEETMANVAHAVLVTNAPFSRRGLANVLSQDEYHKLAQAFVRGGLAVDQPGNRRELTVAGKNTLREMLK